MKKKQCAKRFDFSDFDWTGYTEITGDDLYRINGGAKVENSDAGVAGAKPHDTITRNDGTTVELKEIDIKLAQEKLARQSSSTQTPASAAPAGTSTPNTTATKPTTGRTTGNTGSSSGGSSSSSGSGSSSSSSSSDNQPKTYTRALTPAEQQEYAKQAGQAQSNTAGSAANNSNNNTSFQGTQAGTPQQAQSKNVSTGEKAVSITDFTADEQKQFNEKGYFLTQNGAILYVNENNRDALNHGLDVLSDPERGISVHAINTDTGNETIYKGYGDLYKNLYSKPNDEGPTFSFGFGGKLALIGGVGAETGVIRDGNGSWYWYVSGSLGCGIQTPAVTRTDLTVLEYLNKSKGRTYGTTSDSTQEGISSSLTADICLGLTGTYDLNNLNSSGLPNSWSLGSVGGGVWKTWTAVVPIHKNEE